MEELIRVFDTPTLRVSYDATNTWLYNQWQGTHTVDTLYRYAPAVFACLAAYPCVKILSDHSQLAGDWQSAAAWLGSQYFGGLAREGVTSFAWVYSDCYLDRLAMEKTLNCTEDPALVIFDDLASAYDWLRRRPHQPPRAWFEPGVVASSAAGWPPQSAPAGG